MAQLERFQRRIHEVIPVARHMEVRLEDYNGRQLLVSAPLAPNHNHQGTGFGGSIYSVAVVAAWGLAELVLEDWQLTGQVVVQQGAIDYSEPVTGDFYAIGELPDEAGVARFRKSLARHGKGRITIRTQVYCGHPRLATDDRPVATLEGRFVVQDAGPLVR
ncbi:thioesterase domain-containing protein [Marinobacter sp. X15-166B]|uniref:thioesterase domain-containing protein n=1 Tax=Marinobacter sp. X15-166B TaxID=1897620 RepID=UPI00085BE6BE|nr:thioesterase domain-containing protein [Marinobacter sp. X15-166B]OEY67341.1 thioesterase [Marinobacter sp. X15-166B]